MPLTRDGEEWFDAMRRHLAAREALDAEAAALESRTPLGPAARRMLFRDGRDLRAENARLRAVLEELGRSFVHDGDVLFKAQPVAHWRERIRMALEGER